MRMPSFAHRPARWGMTGGLLAFVFAALLAAPAAAGTPAARGGHSVVAGRTLSTAIVTRHAVGRSGSGTPISHPYVWFYDYHSGKCVAVKGASRSEGAPLVQEGCANSQSFGWLAVKGFSGSEYFYRNENSNMCMAVKNSSKKAGAALVQEPCNYKNPPANERFGFVMLEFIHGYTWWFVQSQLSGFCMNVTGDTKASGAAMQLWYCPSPSNTHKSEWTILVKAGTKLPCPCTLNPRSSYAIRTRGSSNA